MLISSIILSDLLIQVQEKYKKEMDKQNGSKLHIPPTISWLLNRSHTKKYSQFFWKKVRRMAHEQKDDHTERANVLCRKRCFLHSSTRCFIPSCEWIYLLKVNLKTSLVSVNNEMNYYFSFKELMTIPSHHLMGQREN